MDYVLMMNLFFTIPFVIAARAGDVTINIGLLTIIGGFIVSCATAYGLYRKLGPERAKLEAEANRLEAEREKIIAETYKEVVGAVREEVASYREELAKERIRSAQAIQQQAEAQTRTAHTQAELASVLAKSAQERSILQKRINELELENAKLHQRMEALATQHAAEMQELLKRFEDLRRQTSSPDRRHPSIKDGSA